MTALRSVTDELVRRGAETTSRRRGSALAHLGNTYAILAGWGQPEHVALGGLLHDAYRPHGGAALFFPDERITVRRLAGEAAEQLAWLCSSVNHLDVLAAFTDPVAQHAKTATVPNTLTGGTIAVSRADAGALFSILVACDAEESCNADGGPGTWLGRASSLAHCCTFFCSAPPPVFDNCAAVVKGDAETELSRAYATAAAASYETGALRAAVDRTPWLAEPYLLLAYRALEEGKMANALAWARDALRLINVWSTPWDKRLGIDQWRALADALIEAQVAGKAATVFFAGRVSDAFEANVAWPAGMFGRLTAAGVIGDATPSERTRTPKPVARRAAPALPERFAAFISRLRDRHGNRSVLAYPNLPARPWLDPKNFAFVAAIEGLAPQIIAEIKALDDAAFQLENESIARAGNWDAFPLQERGRNGAESKRCPLTMQLIESHRTVTTLAGRAYVSRLAPGTKVAPHRGRTNLCVSCYFGVSIPDGAGIKAGGVAGGLQEGKCVVVNAASEHEFWNAGDRDCIVLVVDLWHPDLSEGEVALIETLHNAVSASAELAL